MDLYNGEINEFVNWTTGQNELTEIQVTQGDLKISGESIRNLIGKHIKTPFVTYEDSKENKIYFFSSEESKFQWLQHRNEDNNEKYEALVLYSMTKPSDYVIELDDVFSSKEHRYITSDSSGQEDSNIQFTWKIKLGNTLRQDTLEVTCQIANPSGKTITIPSIHSTSGAGNIGTASLNVEDYLEEGTNTVTISMWGMNTGATVTVVQYIHVVSFSIESSFEYQNGIPNSNTISVPVTLKRNDKSLSASIYVYIDGEQAYMQTAAVNSSNDNYQIVIQNPKTGSIRKYRNSYIDTITGNPVNIVHTMQIWAVTTFNRMEFKTNLLYYTFIIKSDDSIENYFIPVHTSFPNSLHNGYISNLRLYGTQYESMSIDWGYYTDQISYDTNIPVTWKILYTADGELSITTIETIDAKKVDQPKTLTFIPTEFSIDDDTIQLCAYYNDICIISIPLTIYESPLLISLPSGYDIELSAYNKNNLSEDKNRWSTTGNTISNVTLHGIRYNSNSGWYDHSLRMSGIDSYAEFEYNAFDESDSSINANGRTIEIEFESEKVKDTNDVILTIGSSYVDPNDSTANKPVRIEITPNSAILYNNSNLPVVTTNFKQNERIKLCFIINSTTKLGYDKSKVYIVANGILERASLWEGNLGYDDSQLNSVAKGKITIGKSNSGIKFYSMRVYKLAIHYTSAYNNFVFDNENKNKIVLNNDILIDGQNDISFEKCRNKITTVLIKETDDVINSHFLDTVFLPGAEKPDSLTNGILELYSRENGVDNVIVQNCLFRKHGQSTLKYPIPSIKIWFGKKFNSEGDNDIPIMTCENQSSLRLNKNRYKMRPNNIPSNKYILLANYADSSGVHNGGIQRLILETWYNANIDGYFRLRTIPLLFSSIESSEKNKYPEACYNGRVWSDYFNTQFPYLIRVGADSFPCVVFYESRNGDKKYIGQYVFMDDKKSDYTYGERSIYKADPTDPFCLKIENKDNDTDSNLIWDNLNVLRIEVLDVNDIFTSYMSFEKDGVAFDSVITDNDGIQKYNWEQNFEMIYPDPDDLEGRPIGPYITKKGKTKYQETDTTKFGEDSDFRKAAAPFVNWMKWLTDTRNNYNITTQWWLAGTYSSALLAFEATAADHLDLYKMAAYYIFMLRFALTDSGERNVQIKTYDGVHFHYEPWDMDIALGNKNDGGIAFNPPVSRQTVLLDGSYAISGKSLNTSNWLWDALEAWLNWSNTIVPKVADALYTAGLKYYNSIDMLDNQYANKWNETVYNESGYFKYIVSGQDLTMYLNWLQGARTPHRHWWLNTSMNYYDAKWGCGTFKTKAITFYAGHTNTGLEENIVIGSSTPSYVLMVINQNATNLGTIEIYSGNDAHYNIGNRALNYKVPSDIYGAVNIETLDFSCVGGTFNRILLENSYDEEAGAKLKVLNIGVKLTDTNDQNVKTGPCNVAYSGTISGGNALSALETLNIRGLRGGISSTGNMYNTFTLLRDLLNEARDLVNVKEVYAMGANIDVFYSSYRGNNFDILELPSSITELDLRNSTWNTIEFWDADIVTIDDIPENIDESDEEYIAPGTATYTKHNLNGNYNFNVPITLNTVRFNGTTGKSEKSKLFVLNWINSIIASLGNDPTEEQINNALRNKHLYMDSVDWTSGEGRTLLTFEELSLIAKLDHHLSGYILLASDSNNPLESEQLNSIISWFGNDVFTRSSGGIIIDYNLDRTIVSVGGPEEYFYIELGTLKPCLKEGGYTILNATRFLLREEQQEYVWKLRQPLTNNTGRDLYKECYIDNSGRLPVLRAKESSFDLDYEVEVFTNVDNNPVSIVIKIIVSTYPTLDIQKTATCSARESGSSISLYEYGIYGDFFVNVSGQSTVDILNISYSIYNYLTNVETNIGFSETLPNDYTIFDGLLKYKKSSVQDGICILTTIQNGDSNIYLYKLKANVGFIAKTITIEKDIYVINDYIIIDTYGASPVSMVIANAYYSLYNINLQRFYRTDLLNIRGDLDFSSYTTIVDLLTERLDSIFLYLPNVTGINLANCSLLESTKDNINQMNFSNMTSLQTLNIHECSSLTEDIDLTDCPEITSVAATGTSINVYLPHGTKVTSYSLGSPTEVILDEPTSIAPANVSVTDITNLDFLELINIPNNKSFTMFGKIMGIS